MPMPMEFAQALEIGHASGWQLATGGFTAKGPTKPSTEGMPGDTKGPKSKPWVFTCLALPILLLMVAGMGFAGHVSSSGAGKAMLLLGLVGVVAMIAVASLDYVDSMFGQAEEEMAKVGGRLSGGGARAMEESKAQMKKVLVTKCTPYLWATLALYVLVAGCGLITLSAPTKRPKRAVAPAPEAYLASQTDTTSQAGIASAGPVIYHPNEPSGEPPVLGPVVTPTEGKQESEEPASSLEDLLRNEGP